MMFRIDSADVSLYWDADPWLLAGIVCCIALVIAVRYLASGPCSNAATTSNDSTQE